MRSAYPYSICTYTDARLVLTQLTPAVPAVPSTPPPPYPIVPVPHGRHPPGAGASGWADAIIGWVASSTVTGILPLILALASPTTGEASVPPTTHLVVLPLLKVQLGGAFYRCGCWFPHLRFTPTPHPVAGLLPHTCPGWIVSVPVTWLDVCPVAVEHQRWCPGLLPPPTIAFPPPPAIVVAHYGLIPRLL